MSKNVIKKEDVNTALFPYLRLRNDSYILDISEEKAAEIGIAKEDFESTLKELEFTNEYIQKAKEDPNHEISLFDPENIDRAALQQSMPSGTLSPNGQEQVGTGFFAPYYTAKVRFSCRGNGAISPFFTCRTKALGDWKSKTQIGNSITFTDIDVNLDASNINVSITFQTTDSNGALCNWKAML